MSAHRRLEWRRIASLSATLWVHLAMLAFLLRGEPVPPAQPLQPSDSMVVRLITEPRMNSGDPAPSLRTTRPQAASSMRKAPSKVARVRSTVPQPRRLGSTERAQIVQAPSPPPQEEASSDETEPSASPLQTTISSTASAAPSAGGDVGGGGPGGSRTSSGIRFATKAAPLMPRSMRGSNWSGYALVGLRVGVDGRAKEIVVLRSSGVRAIDRTARLAAERSTYVPHMIQGKPVEFWGIVPVVFGKAVPDVERDLLDLTEKWRSSHPDVEVFDKTRPAV